MNMHVKITALGSAKLQYLKKKTDIAGFIFIDDV